MTNETIKRKPGRPPASRKAIKYTLNLPADVAHLAEQAKQDGGLGNLLADCLRQKYTRTSTSKADALKEKD